MMRLPLSLLLGVILAACTVDRAPLVASDVTVTRPLPGSAMSAGYLQLHNTTNEPISITRVTSPDFRSVEMHESMLDGGIARMVALPELSIAPGDAVQLQRGGKHLMLMGPVAEPETVTLQFYAGDALVLSLSAFFED